MWLRSNFSPVLLLLCVVGLMSCHSENKLARGFIDSEVKPALFVTYAADWEQFFIKPQGNSASDSFARRYFPYRSYFLKNDGIAVVDSIFKASLNAGLDTRKFLVYGDSSVDQFLNHPGDKYIVEFVQLYMEEKTMPVSDTLYFASDYYIQFDTVISRMDLCFWLRINPVDDTTTAAPLLYASFTLIDQFRGNWEYDMTNDQYSYRYDFTAFEPKDIYYLIVNSGKNISDYIYDYFLNLYLYENMHRKPDAYYTWNGSFLRRAGQSRFIFMKNPE